MRLLPLVLVPLVLLPAVPAAADSPLDDVRVTAVVQTADGLAFRSREASSPGAGEALAERWDDERGVVAADVAHPVRLTATDPRRPDQWGLDRLQAERAWSTTRGTGVVVAVLDTGVQGDHPDLAGRVLAPIDLVEPTATRTVSVDPHGHGTHVAGVVAASAGNGVGGSGLAPGAKVLPVRVLDAGGGGRDDVVAKGIVRAVDAGAHVLNLSLGGPNPSRVLDAAVAYAVERGVVVVAASGNDGDGDDLVEYPAASPGVLAVGAVDRHDLLAPFSSTGSHLGVTAPGVAVLSTWNGGRYATASGTSMASPFAAAAAALLLEAGVPGRQVRARLTGTATDLGAPGHDPQHGAGRLDVLAALGATAPAPAPVSAPAPAPAPAPVASVEPAPGLPAPVEPAPVAPAPVVPAPAEPAPAAPVVAGPLPVPDAAAPAPAAPPVDVARLAAAAKVVTAGAPVVLRARVLRDGRPHPGAVVLERSTGGAWTALRTGRVGPDGLVAWTVVPDRGGLLRVRVADVASSAVRVDVRQRVSAAPARGVVTGTVAPRGRTAVVLQRRTGRGWATVSRATSAADGRYRLTERLAPGSAVRVVSAARSGLLAGTSAVLRAR